MYHVVAPFQFDAVNKRKLQAPFEARLLEVKVRPGDHVQKGELLAKMDTYDLQKKLLDAESQASQHDAEYHKAVSDDSKQADAQIALDQGASAKALVDLYKKQIDLADIRAPFDGVVIEGDLIDQKDAPKKEGDQLFTIAADQGLRAMISVSERDIQMLKPGQHGNLATSSLPTDKFAFTVDRVVPLGQAKEGDNVFTVYGTLDSKQDPTWAPGLGGEVRIDVRQRPLIWTWTHKLIDYVRLKLWI
jgi:multidrug efflux pump subunit AcrA (membrane-fusion protein)